MTGYQIEPGDHQSALKRKAEGGPQADSSSPVHPLLTLQSQIGNAQVARLLAQRDAAEEMQAKHELSVQRDEDDDKGPQGKHDLSLQRDEDDDKGPQGKHDLSAQRDTDDTAQADHEHVGIEGGPVGPDTAQQIHSARGGGSTLDSGTRATMEGGFGTSFEDVRVHHDSQSDTLNRRLTSHAFTTGSDIFLRSDASPSDSRLMAHELTHVVQQRSMSGGGGMSVGAAGDPHESHADAMADSVLSNSAAPAQAAPAAAQREADDVEAQHDLSLQRDEDDDKGPQGKHDLSLQREEEKDPEAMHDLSVQREEEKDPEAMHDLSVQREEEKDPEAMHDLSIQRAAEATEDDVP